MPKISLCLWFDHQAEEAARFYVSIFMAAMLKMKKINIAALKEAYERRG